MFGEPNEISSPEALEGEKAAKLFKQGYRLYSFNDGEYILKRDGKELFSGPLVSLPDWADLYEALEMPLPFSENDNDLKREIKNGEPIIKALIELSKINYSEFVFELDELQEALDQEIDKLKSEVEEETPENKQRMEKAVDILKQVVNKLTNLAAIIGAEETVGIKNYFSNLDNNKENKEDALAIGGLQDEIDKCLWIITEKLNSLSKGQKEKAVLEIDEIKPILSEAKEALEKNN